MAQMFLTLVLLALLTNTNAFTFSIFHARVNTSSPSPIRTVTKLHSSAHRTTRTSTRPYRSGLSSSLWKTAKPSAKTSNLLTSLSSGIIDFEEATTSATTAPNPLFPSDSISQLEESCAKIFDLRKGKVRTRHGTPTRLSPLTTSTPHSLFPRTPPYPRTWPHLASVTTNIYGLMKSGNPT